jgi:hypothetical protein
MAAKALPQAVRPQVVVHPGDPMRGDLALARDGRLSRPD